jgi:hypothetical protein
MERNKLGFKQQSINFSKYFVIFLIVPIVGTLLHEFGHYIVAILNGYEARIAYASTISSIDRITEPDIYFVYILGGPITTWIQSLIPFVIMVIFYTKEKRIKLVEKGKLPPLYILLLGFTTICGRFIFNAAGYMFTHSTKMDESKMASYLNINPDILVYPFAFAAWTILIISIYMLPRNIRFSVFLGAILGAAIGYYSWYSLIGPIIMPV